MMGVWKSGFYIAWATGCCLLSGCLFSSKTQLNDSQAQNRILSEQNRAQLAEIGNLQLHNRQLESKVAQTEEEVAFLKKQADLQQQQLADYEREHNELYEQFKALARKEAQEAFQPSPGQTGGTNNPTRR
jgi:uncharacterized protein YlxW (UPF0749 family)